jgi:hypothetical protein
MYIGVAFYTCSTIQIGNGAAKKLVWLVSKGHFCPKSFSFNKKAKTHRIMKKMFGKGQYKPFSKFRVVI